MDSYPKATVRWYLNGHEIQPSKDFGLDNLEDGTSILTLTEVFPDDAGELVCEVHNEKGIATSTTQLNITGGQFFFFNYKSKHILLASSFSITFYFYFMIYLLLIIFGLYFFSNFYFLFCSPNEYNPAFPFYSFFPYFHKKKTHSPHKKHMKHASFRFYTIWLWTN